MGAAASSAEGSGGLGPATDSAAASGASSPKTSLCELKGSEADKWRSLVGELEAICKEHQASLAEGRHGGGHGRADSPSGRTPRSTPPRSPPSRVRGSSILKKESSFTGSTDDAPP
eukprot:Rhum_TRINITY_DN10816_c1_g1::Rhum_TRINITY_DN10816_c1_g1_i1::g.40526::m.40526